MALSHGKSSFIDHHLGNCYFNILGINEMLTNREEAIRLMNVAVEARESTDDSNKKTCREFLDYISSNFPYNEDDFELAVSQFTVFLETGELPEDSCNSAFVPYLIRTGLKEHRLDLVKSGSDNKSWGKVATGYGKVLVSAAHRLQERTLINGKWVDKT